MFEYMDHSKILITLDLFFSEFLVTLLFFRHFGMMLYLLFVLFRLNFFFHKNVVRLFKGDPIVATNLQPNICFSLRKIFLFFGVFLQE